MSSTSHKSPLFWVIAALVAAGAATASALIQTTPGTDLVWYVIPWMKAVLAGGLSSLSGEFSIYSPAYIYLLYLVSFLTPFTGIVAAIKLLNAPFVAGAAAALGLIVASCSQDRDRGWIAGGLVFVTPTVLVNAFAWGQADIIYTCFALLFVLFACQERPLEAALFFGVALAFKLQTMFLSPLLLYLLLTRQMGFRHIALIPLAYLLFMVPAAIAGRPLFELLTIYARQAYAFPFLSLYSANPWWFVRIYNLLPYVEGTILGILLGGAVALGIAFSARTLPKGPASTLIVAIVCAAVIPYVLPKMIDRYFFMADLLSIALALVRPRYWICPILFQLGSLTSYLVYFDGLMSAPAIAFIPMTLGVIFVLHAARAEGWKLARPRSAN